jgi:hypothetical protein
VARAGERQEGGEAEGESPRGGFDEQCKEGRREARGDGKARLLKAMRRPRASPATTSAATSTAYSDV